MSDAQWGQGQTKASGMDFPLRYILSNHYLPAHDRCVTSAQNFSHPQLLIASKQSPLLEQDWSDAETKGQREKNPQFLLRLELTFKFSFMDIYIWFF